MRIFKVDILTFNGFFDSESDILKPRWLLTAAAALGVTPQTVFDYLARGLLAGHQLVKGQPWQINLSVEQIDRLRARAHRMRHSKKEAS